MTELQPWRRQRCYHLLTLEEIAFFVSKGLNPRYLQVLKTYCEGAEIEISDKN